MKRSTFASPYVVWMILFTIAPLLFVAYYAFTDSTGVFTFENIVKTFDGQYLMILWRSIYLAFLCTVICIIIGYPAAYFLASKDFSKNQTLLVLILLPMWMNFLLRTYAMMSILEDTGLLNKLLKSMGLDPIYMLGTQGAVLLGMVYNYVPFMILPIHTILKKMDVRVIEAAEDLGASPVDVFRRVIFPMSMPGVISGITMVFMPAVTTFAISKLLGSGMFLLYGDLIEKQFLELNSWNFGSALSMIMMVLIIISIGLLNKADPKKEGSGVL